jgi:hypothetical protein
MAVAVWLRVVGLWRRAASSIGVFLLQHRVQTLIPSALDWTTQSDGLPLRACDRSMRISHNPASTGVHTIGLGLLEMMDCY